LETSLASKSTGEQSFLFFSHCPLQYRIPKNRPENRQGKSALYCLSKASIPVKKMYIQNLKLKSSVAFLTPAEASEKRRKYCITITAFHLPFWKDTMVFSKTCVFEFGSAPTPSIGILSLEDHSNSSLRRVLIIFLSHI